MLGFVIGYLFLFIFRPFEYWQQIADYHIERIYMFFILAMLLIWRERRYIPHRINNAIIAFFAVMTISSMLAYKWDDAYITTFDYFKLIVFYFVIILSIRSEEDLKTFIIGYIAVMLIYTGKSAWEFFLHDRYIWRMGVKRMVGVDVTYGDPNSFAASIAYSIPFLWALITSRLEKRWMRRMLFSYGMLAIACIIFTGSRSGMVTTLLFCFLAWFGSRRKLFGAVLITVALLFIWNNISRDYQLRFESTFIKGVAPPGAYESAEGRMAAFRQGIRIAAKNPVLGMGPGNFKYGWDNVDIGPSPHNLYGELLGETGVVGFLAFFVFVAAVLRTHRGIKRSTKRLLNAAHMRAQPGLSARLRFFNAISTASVQCIILLLFNGIFGHNLYRYNWLWIGALGVLESHFLKSVIREA